MTLSGAKERRQSDEPDIVLGHLSLWVGTGEGFSWPWLDLAVRIGEGWEKVVDVHGPLVQRPDLLAFLPALREFVEGRQADLLLASTGGPMRIILHRSEFGSISGELWLRRSATTQTILFPLWEEALPVALKGAEATAERLADVNLGWRPGPPAGLGDPLLPRDSGIVEPGDPPSQPQPWDAELGTGEDVAFEYTHDGYGWYAVEVRVGQSVGGFGGSYLTDSMGDLLRAGLALLARAPRVELSCNAEPGLTRVEFERVALGADLSQSGRLHYREGCRILIRELGQSGSEQPPEFDALCRSPRAVADAIYRMALPHFAAGAGPWSDAMAALEGALARVPRDPSPSEQI
jgi:hypothetical protein